MKRKKSISNIQLKDSYSNVFQLASSSNDSRKILKNRDQLIRVGRNPPSLEIILHHPPSDVFVVHDVNCGNSHGTVAARQRAVARHRDQCAKVPSAHITRGRTCARVDPSCGKKERLTRVEISDVEC